MALDRTSLQRLNHRHQLIIQMSLMGYKQSEIVEATGMDQSSVSRIMNDPLYIEALEEARERYFGRNVRTVFQKLLPKTIETLQELAFGPNSRDSVKLEACKEIFNRCLGRPKEQLEITKTKSISELYDKLDELSKFGGLRNIKAEKTKEALITDATQATDAIIVEEVDPMDDWIEKNL